MSNNEFVCYWITRDHMRREMYRNCPEGFAFILRNVEGSLWLQDTHYNLENNINDKMIFDYMYAVFSVEPHSKAVQSVSHCKLTPDLTIWWQSN